MIIERRLIPDVIENSNIHNIDWFTTQVATGTL